MARQATPRFRDYPNGDGRVSALDERVSNVRTSLTNFEAETRSSFAAVNSQINSLGHEMRSSMAQLAQAFQERGRTQWPVILMVLGLIVTVLLGFGGAVGLLALTPVQEATSENKSDIKALTALMSGFVSSLPESYITRVETERVSKWSEQSRQQVEADLKLLQESKLDRSAWMLRNDSVNDRISELNRRLDEIRADQGDTYNARDVILDLKTQVRELQELVFARRSVAP